MKVNNKRHKSRIWKDLQTQVNFWLKPTYFDELSKYEHNLIKVLECAQKMTEGSWGEWTFGK